MQGCGGGLDDSRGALLPRCAEWIEVHRPVTFVLENVKGLYVMHPQILLELLERLAGITNAAGKQLYTVEWRILNPRIHAGVPQNRERIFIVGARNDRKRTSMQWPAEAGVDV